MVSKEPITFVLFGATGDLAKHKILPALCALYTKGALPEGSEIVAFSRRPWGDDTYRSFIEPSLKAFSADQVQNFLARVSYAQGTFGDPTSFAALKEKITTSEAFYHLAIHPEFYEAVVHGLGKAKLLGKLLIEKPFGHNYASAFSLENNIEKYFPPECIFRVDHYLGKEGLEALLAQRSTDTTLESSLVKEHVASVACRIFETVGIRGRGEFYDSVGALKDVGQNHLLVMLATLLMEIPPTLTEIPHARALALQALEPRVFTQGGLAVVRGQYEGYQGEPDVKEDSETETYFKIEVHSRSPRWDGVPLVLEAGKALKEKKNEIEVVYKNGTHRVFDMETPRIRDAYERVVEAALLGDISHFAGIEEVLAAWKFIEPLGVYLPQIPLHIYPKGSAGPGNFL